MKSRFGSAVLLSAFIAVGCSSEREPDCHSLSIDECEATEGCAIETARPWNGASMCYAAEEPVFCRSSDVICSNLVTAAKDPNGACWLFNAECGDIPADWTYQSEAGSDCSTGINTCM